MPSTPTFTRRLFSATMGAVVLSSLVAVPTLGHGPGSHPEYLVAVVPTSVAAGTVAMTKLRVTLLRSAHHDYPIIGSLGITPPTGFTISSATATRGIKPLPVVLEGGVAVIDDADLRRAGAKVSVVLRSVIACGVDGASSWSVLARGASDFSDTTSRTVRRDPSSTLVSPVAGCSLTFLRQPALTGVDAVITSVPATPGGASVAVQLLDGNGHPASEAGVSVSVSRTPGTGSNAATLGGDPADATNGSGVATFAATLDTVANGYRLDATAGAGIDGVTSDTFDVPGVAVACSGSCGGSSSKGTTSATVEGTTSGGVLTLSLGQGDVDCNNAVNRYYQGSSEPIVFDVTQGTGRTVVTIKLEASSVDKPLGRYLVCFSSPVSSFVSRYHAQIAAGEAGVLHGCGRHWNDPRGVGRASGHDHGSDVNAQPCMEKRWKDEDGNVYVRFSVPPGDPRGKI